MFLRNVGIYRRQNPEEHHHKKGIFVGPQVKEINFLKPKFTWIIFKDLVLISKKNQHFFITKIKSLLVLRIISNP
jgi:hypothetical protein